MCFVVIVYRSLILILFKLPNWSINFNLGYLNDKMKCRGAQRSKKGVKEKEWLYNVMEPYATTHRYH